MLHEVDHKLRVYCLPWSSCFNGESFVRSESHSQQSLLVAYGPSCHLPPRFVFLQPKHVPHLAWPAFKKNPRLIFCDQSVHDFINSSSFQSTANVFGLLVCFTELMGEPKLKSRSVGPDRRREFGEWMTLEYPASRRAFSLRLLSRPQSVSE